MKRKTVQVVCPSCGWKSRRREKYVHWYRDRDVRQAYFAAREGKCFLDFTYQGLIYIATSEGSIVSLDANVVYAWDELKFKQGTNAFLDHIISMNPPKDPDEIARNPKLIWEHLKCVYSIATLPNGSQPFVILPKWKLLKIWNETGASENPINNLWPEEWLRKTAVKYFSKTFPSAQRLVTAVSVMNEHEGIPKKKKSESQLLKRMKKK